MYSHTLIIETYSNYIIRTAAAVPRRGSRFGGDKRDENRESFNCSVCAQRSLNFELFDSLSNENLPRSAKVINGGESIRNATFSFAFHSSDDDYLHER